METEPETVLTITINPKQSSNKAPEIAPLSLSYEQFRCLQEKLLSLGL